MASEITQKLGFEASSAIQTLNTLSTALSSVNRQLRAMATATNTSPTTVIQGFAQTAQAAQQASTQVQNAGQAFVQTGNSGQKAAQGITLSWETMLRVVQTQVLIRSLTALVGLFNDSAEAAGKFQVDVARIATISEGPGSSIKDLTAKLNDLSVQLGRPITEVTAAAFEALQNDLGTTAQTMDLLGGSAHELALITGGDLTQSVNALSSVLKSYNLDISESENISDIFFETIKVGRVKLADLSDTLGTITPLAAQLGVNFAQVGASIAAITQSGTNAATANTQLRNVLQKLIKPTKDLQAAFDELGVKGGAELIKQTGGLIPALKALEGTVHGDEQALAKMFGTIRGQLGVFNLLANNSTIVNKALDTMAHSAGAAKAALATIEAQDQRKLDRSIQELDKSIRDLGNSTLKVKLFFTQFATETVKGFETLVGVTGDVTGTMEGLLNPGQETNGLTTILADATTGVTALGLGFVSALEGLTGLNVGASSLLQGIIGSSLTALVEGRKRAQDNIKKITDEAEANITANLKKEVQARTDVMGSYLSNVTKVYQDDVKAFNARSVQMIAIQNSTIKSFEGTVKDISSSIDDFFSNAQSRLQDRLGESRVALQELADFKFDRSISNKSPRSQAFALDEESAKRTTAALKALADADASGSEEARKNALDQIKSAEAFDKRSQAASDAADLAGKSRDALDREQSLLEAVAKSSQHRADVEKQAQQDITKLDAETTKARLANLDALLKKQAELVDEQNNPNTSNDRQGEIKKELSDISTQFGDQFTQLTQDRLLKTLNLDKVFQKAATEAASALNGVKSEWAGARQSLQDALSKEPFTATAKVVQQTTGNDTGNALVNKTVQDVAKNFSPLQNPAEQANQLITALQGVKQQAELAAASFRSMGLSIGVNTNQVDALVSKLGTVDGSAKSTVNAVGQLNQTVATATADQLTDASAALTKLQGQVAAQKDAGTLTDQQAKTLQTAIDTLFNSIDLRQQQLAKNGLFGNGIEEAADHTLAQITAKFGALDLGITPEKALAMLQPITDAAGSTSLAASTALVGTADGMQTAFTNASTNSSTAIAGIQTTINSINTSGAISQMNALAQAAAQALAAAQAAAAAGGGQSQHFGGAIFRAAGGPVTRGVDTRMVGMQPGEFVMNKNSSNKFFSQLHAMNAGQAPSFREHGGAVTNIGDINVSVNSGNADNISGHDIAIALRRELRRKTSKF